MKRFLLQSLIFSILLIIPLTTLEIIVGHIPNSYSYKYTYVKTHGENIQALAIGHSQLYDGFKPESFFLPSFNLCNSAQSYVDNYYLLRELLPYMPNLKMTIMPIGYLNVGVINNDSSLSDRSCYYHKYMNIDYDGRLPLKYRFECFDPNRAFGKVNMYYRKHSDIVGCDSMGRRNTHYLRDRVNELGYDNILEGYTRKEHDYNKLCLADEYYLIQAIDLLMQKNISIFLVSPPYYWDCFKNTNMEQKRFIKEYMNNLSERFPVYYIDLESDTSFLYDESTLKSRIVRPINILR